MGIPLSEGTVDSVLEEMTKKADGMYREIKRRIEQRAERGSGCGRDRLPCQREEALDIRKAEQGIKLPRAVGTPELRNKRAGIPRRAANGGVGGRLFSGAIENPSETASSVRGSASVKRAEEL
ncbi:MAG: hypothetical protein LBQ88_18140 [Treponema sp.]|jgi:orotidine-5'-phosphate decarboxylase|nr:hypothetical protein [Treponema sp.]